MKHPYLAKLRFLLLLLTALGFAPLMAQAQTGSVSGRVVDEKKEGIPGATVIVDGTTLGSSSNVDGTYSIAAVPAGPHTLVVSYVGYNTVRLAVTVVAGQNAVADAALSVNATQLSEAVVIGYGTQRKQDVTGAVTQIDTRQFVRGQVTNPEQLIQGKIAGVNVTTNGGQPGDGAQIRIRGGSSINSNNDPLIVIDGVPVQTGGVTGGNPLSLINPNDIESYTVLKDASSTAIYGSRAAAGVILITTKKGLRGEPTRVNFSSQFSLSQVARKQKVLTGDEFRALINSQEYRNAIGDTDRVNPLNRELQLGTANTDWQNEIFRTALTFDNNLSVTGAAGKTAYRVSYGNLHQQGIVKTSDLTRNTLSVGLTPMLLNDRLKVDINLKGSINENHFPDGGAVGSAVTFDPTQPVRDTSAAFLPFGGYFENLSGTGINGNAPSNPVAMLALRRDHSVVKRSIGNIQLDYKIPGINGLRANYNIGYDFLRGDQQTENAANSRGGFRAAPAPSGTLNYTAQNRNTWLNEVYLSYNHDFDTYGRVDMVAGYSYQNFRNSKPNTVPTYLNGAPVVGATVSTYPYEVREYALQSYYGRLNYAFRNRYLLTATLRADQSSRFGGKYRTGYFPAVGLGYRLKEESFLRDVAVVSDLKLRASYGQTGQQDIFGDGLDAYYGSQKLYTTSDPTANYPFGGNYISTIRPEGYIENRKWETTTTYDVGLDFGLGKTGRFTGTVDAYYKRSTDLLFNGTLPAGSNLTNKGTLNIGTFEVKGFEAALNTAIIQRENVNWNVNINGSYIKTNVVETLDRNQPTGGISGIGNNIQTITAGQPIRVFYVRQQRYDDRGNPISPANNSAAALTAAYVDQNGDGVIDGKDLIATGQQPDPKVLLGFSSNLSVRNFYLNFSLRSNLGASTYNGVSAQLNAYDQLYGFDTFLNNNGLLNNGVSFQNQQLLSSYFVQNANFLRMENITLGYNFSNLAGSTGHSFGVSLAVQNAFLLTRYKGIDPETQGGIDSNYYPRSRTYTLGFNIGF